MDQSVSGKVPDLVSLGMAGWRTDGFRRGSLLWRGSRAVHGLRSAVYSLYLVQ